MKSLILAMAAALAPLSIVSAAALVPPALAGAAELAALPDGSWLALDKRGLHLYDAAGAQRASIKMRAKKLDTRASANGVLAVVLDSASDQARLLQVNAAAGTLQALPALPQQSFGVDALCLYRDAQQLTHLFIMAANGQGEQWLVDGGAPALVRRLALPPDAKSCRVDDALHQLLVLEPGMGVWAYEAESEAPAARLPLALRKPFGTLDGDATALAVLPGAVAVLDGAGKALHWFEQQAGAWRQRKVQRLPASSQLFTRAEGQAMQLLARQGSAWARLASVAAPLPAVGAVPSAVIMPQAQTDSVAQMGDVADDPAIWVHPGDASKSRVLGTNKKRGLEVYDMQGRQQQFLDVGRLNNVDLRQGVRFDGAPVDLAVATQRDDNSVVLFGIDGDGKVSELLRLPTDLTKIYGICLYQPVAGGLETFVNDADGRYRQYRIERKGGSYAATLVRQFKTASQPEGCVADDAKAMLYLGEEKRGLWVMPADAAQPAAMHMALAVGPVLHADVEGVALYHGDKASYVVVSSQGSNSYVVLDAAPPYRLRGTFRIGFNRALGIDGTAETDGLEVTSRNLGGPYARGMLVIQDGYKHLPDGNQNFKYVSWADVADALKLD
jgi:3-phytase